MSEVNPIPQKSGRNQILFWGLIAVGLAVMIWIRQGREPSLEHQGLRHSAVGHSLPELELVGLTGTSTDVNLRSLKGSVVLINFWGTWCEPCRRELPHIAQLRRDFAARSDFRLLAVSCGSEEPEDLEELRTATKQFLAQQKIDLPTYADPNGTTRRAAGMVLGELGLGGYPTTVLLDRTGVVRAIWDVGFVPGIEVDMKKAIEEVLDGKQRLPTGAPKNEK